MEWLFRILIVTIGAIVAGLGIWALVRRDAAAILLRAQYRPGTRIDGLGPTASWRVIALLGAVLLTCVGLAVVVMGLLVLR